MGFETQPLPAAAANSLRPEQRLEIRNAAQIGLMTRFPGTEMDWAMKFAATFGRLFDTDEDFRELATHAVTEKDENLFGQLKERLEAEVESQPKH